MTNASIPSVVFPNNPQLKDVLDLFKKEMFLAFNCHHIATVESFNEDNQTLSATINYKRTFFQNNSTNSFVPVLVDYPVAIDCPVVVLGGGPASLTMPIAQGDQCLLLFNDRDLDNWFQNIGGGAVATPRLHAFADAIAIVGLRSLAKSITDYDTVRAVLRSGSAAVGVREDSSKVLITKDYPTNATTLNSLLQDLITAIKAITVPVSGVQSGGSTVTSGTPNNSGTLTSIASDIAGLLE